MTGNDDGKCRKKRKKQSTSNDDGETGKKRKKKSTSETNKRKKKTTDDVDEVPVSRRTVRGNPIFDTSGSGSGSGKIQNNLASNLTAGAVEEQGDRLIFPGFCDIERCKVKPSVAVNCDTSYDSTMSYADRCRNVYHRDCVKEAGLLLELDDKLLYCSDKCKNKGDKYCL